MVAAVAIIYSTHFPHLFPGLNGPSNIWDSKNLLHATIRKERRNALRKIWPNSFSWYRHISLLLVCLLPCCMAPQTVGIIVIARKYL